MQRARNARLARQATRIATADADLAGKRGSLPVVMLPANSRGMVPLPDESRAEFLAALRTTADRVFAQPVRDNSAPMSAEAGAARDNTVNDSNLGSMLGSACGTCGGECCTAGGTHAFLRDDSLVRIRAQFADEGRVLTGSEFVQEYARWLPEAHYRKSCVFHTTTGCELPRPMRSDLCNRYLCGGLTQLTRAIDAGGESYIAAADSVHLRRVAHLSAVGVRAVSVAQGTATS
jgi:hypothetical protein